MPRREFLKHSAATAALPLLAGRTETKPVFEISLAQWSLHRTLFGGKLRTLFGGKLDTLQFPAYARRVGLDAVEYVNSFFKDKAGDKAYLGELKRLADDAGVRSLLIMVDGEGALGDPDNSSAVTASGSTPAARARPRSSATAPPTACGS
jgi:hypothetical protein